MQSIAPEGDDNDEAKRVSNGLVDKFAKFVAWSAQVDTVNEQSSPDSKPHHISALNITPHQDAAHHAYFGGQIELVKQGYVENLVLYRCDIASVYPSAVQSTSLMRGSPGAFGFSLIA
jgi:hypothetical protein